MNGPKWMEMDRSHPTNRNGLNEPNWTQIDPTDQKCYANMAQQ